MIITRSKNPERTKRLTEQPGSAGARLLLAIAALLLGSLAQAQTKYRSAEEAWRVGVAFCSSRNYAASREPFEAALQMAPDDKFRLKVYEALLPAYRQLADFDKFVGACDFLITKSPTAPQQSITRRALLAFAFERGKLDELASRYEDALKKDPQNRTALYVLSELYSHGKPNPSRAAELIERLAKIDPKSNQPANVLQSANLAMQYVKAKKYTEGAELYEKIAPLDEKLAAWHWKEAAAAWLRTGQKAKALAAAKKSAESPPEQRNDLLAHFWHRNLADVFLATGEAKLAIPHYEQAIAKTKIQGYVDGCQKSLAEARAKAGR
jgi:tetratricopeptide (TPR) repeat protein